MKWDPYLMPCFKINSKQIKDLNIRAKTLIKLLLENRRNFVTGFGSDFQDATPKAKEKKKKDPLDYIKKDTICKTVKREKISPWNGMNIQHLKRTPTKNSIFKNTQPNFKNKKLEQTFL